ncbi:MAG: TerB family tellurite resistance protein [Pseudomonadota bacterium]
MDSEQAAKAACGAFLIVAFADAHYADAEEARFLATVANRPEMRAIETETLQAAYNALVRDFSADYAAAAARVLELIGSVKDDAETTEIVKVAARSAIVADEKLMPQEEAALDHVALALGLEKGDV